MPRISVQLCVGSCAGSVMHSSALPHRARRLLDLNGLRGITGLSAVTSTYGLRGITGLSAVTSTYGLRGITEHTNS